MVGTLSGKWDVHLPTLCFLVANMSGRDCNKRRGLEDRRGNRMRWASVELLAG